jgi:hypothetical protein
MREDTGQQEPRPWQAMTVTEVGLVADVVKGGGGKISTKTGDPGEPRKVPSTG